MGRPQQGLLGGQLSQFRPRPMPPRRPNFGEVGGPDAGSVQGGTVGTQAQNEAAVNAVVGAMLSTMATPLAPMAINALTGSNLGRAPVGPLSFLNLMSAVNSASQAVGPGMNFGAAAQGDGIGFGSTGSSEGMSVDSGAATGLGSTGDRKSVV